MNLSNIREVLEARETRAHMQCGLLSDGGVLVSYSLNIPGPVKNAVLYQMVFEVGLEKIRNTLAAYGVQETLGASAAGPFAFFLIKEKTEKASETAGEKARKVKAQMVKLEEESELGRLFDIDVLYPGNDGYPLKVSRTELGKEERDCLVCGEKAFICVRAGRHRVPDVLMKVTDRILQSEEMKRRIFPNETPGFARDIALEALRSMMYEVITTPKPGLVDAENNGAHKDMDITLFFDSALSIAPYFASCVRMGEEMANLPAEELLPHLRPLGRDTEKAMYLATSGVNTHKGAVFTFGLFCAAAGILHARGETADADSIPLLAGKIASSMENGNRGIRNEATGGYPSLRASMKAVFPKEDKETKWTNDMAVRLLMELISRVDDSNAVRRKGEDAAADLRRRAKELLDASDTVEKLLIFTSELDRELIRENISPGGSADLLAAGCFLYLTEPLINKEKSSRI